MTQPFAAQLDADWRFWMREHPELATQFGHPGHNTVWTDYADEAIDRRRAYLRESVERLDALDPATLATADRLHYDLYRDLLATAVTGLDFHLEALPFRGVVPHNLLMPVSQLAGVVQDIPLVFSMMPAASVADYEDILARLTGVARLVDQTIALMTRGAAMGLTPPRLTLRDVPGQIAAQLVADPMTSPLLAAFTAWPALIPPAARARLRDEAARVFTTSTRPAFEALHAFVTRRYLPACRETTSVAALENGAALYAYNIRWHTTLDATPAEIHEIGQSEVRRIRTEMDRVCADAGFAGRFDEFAAFLRTSPQFYFTDAASLLAAYRDIAKRADPALAGFFGRLPRTPYGVLPVPDAAAVSQTTAYYQPGSLVAGRPANFFANTYKLDSRPKWEMEALTLHEAVPGHHLQIAIAQELDGLPEFRKHSSYTAFVEGWALYSEKLGEEMGFYRDPYAKFGQLTYEMWRAARLVVDTGLHAMGWTRQQAIDFFVSNTPKAEQDIVVEIDRYIVWPGQALGYKMGELKIRALRALAEHALGDRFDLRGFHDLLLGRGAVPLDVLHGAVEEWIAARQSTDTGC